MTKINLAAHEAHARPVAHPISQSVSVARCDAQCSASQCSMCSARHVTQSPSAQAGSPASRCPLALGRWPSSPRAVMPSSMSLSGPRCCATSFAAIPKKVYTSPAARTCTASAAWLDAASATAPRIGVPTRAPATRVRRAVSARPFLLQEDRENGAGGCGSCDEGAVQLYLCNSTYIIFSILYALLLS